VEATWDPVGMPINPQDITYSAVAAKLVDSIRMGVEDVCAETGVYVWLTLKRFLSLFGKNFTECFRISGII
jgi:hypothetical protein